MVIIAIIGLFVTLLNRPKSDASSATTNNDAPVSSQGLTIVTPWEITNNDPSTSGFVFQRLNIAETLVAVVKSLTIALKKPSALQQAYIHQIQAIDDKQVKFTLSKPNLSFPAI